MAKSGLPDNCESCGMSVRQWFLDHPKSVGVMWMLMNHVGETKVCCPACQDAIRTMRAADKIVHG